MHTHALAHAHAITQGVPIASGALSLSASSITFHTSGGVRTLTAAMRSVATPCTSYAALAEQRTALDDELLPRLDVAHRVPLPRVLGGLGVLVVGFVFVVVGGDDLRRRGRRRRRRRRRRRCAATSARARCG